MRSARNYVLADQPRRGRARAKGTLVGAACPGNDPREGPAGLRGLLAYQVVASGQAAAVHGTGLRPSAPSGPRETRAGLVSARRGELLQRDPADGARTSTAIYGSPSRACGHAMPVPRGIRGSTPNDSANNVLSFMRFGDDGSMLGVASSTSPVPSTPRLTGLGPAAMRAPGREVLNTDADIYNGTGIGNYGRGGSPPTSHGTGVRPSAVIGAAAAGPRSGFEPALATAPNEQNGLKSAEVDLAHFVRSRVRYQYKRVRPGCARPADHLGIGRGRTDRTARSAGWRTLVRSSSAVRLISAISRSNAPATFCCRMSTSGLRRTRRSMSSGAASATATAVRAAVPLRACRKADLTHRSLGLPRRSGLASSRA